MTEMYQSNISRFLDLPAELRNDIYTFILEKNLQHDLELLNWKECLPCSSITRVNHQIRSECQTLYDETTQNIFRKHHWVFTIDSRFCTRSFRRGVHSQCSRIPPQAPIRSLTVVFDFPCTAYGPRAPIMFDFLITDSGNGSWKLRSPASIVSYYRTMVLENILEANYHAVTDMEFVFKGKNDVWLDVKTCLKGFFDMFDTIPFLSSLEFWEY